LAWANTLPDVKDPVLAYGYPLGGTSLSITKGIISRIEFAPYDYTTAGLRIQIDAAVNHGNSGGPAVIGDNMVGLAVSKLNGAENIGYIIPCEEIKLFLEDVADGRYDGKPALVDDFQTLENVALRSFLKLGRSAAGAVVHRPYSSDPGYPLKEWDVVTRIGDTPVDDQGMIRAGDNLRVLFTYLVQKLSKNGKVPLTVIRAGKEIKVEVPVITSRPTVIPDLGGAYPSYFVFGPVVFSGASTFFVGGMTGGRTGPATMNLLVGRGSPLLRRMGDKPKFEGESLVVISSPYFPHKSSKGYPNPASQVVKTVNGIAIKNLPHLVEVLRDSKEEYIAIEFDIPHGETHVFSRPEMLAITDEVLTDNGIRSQGSPDVMAVWNAKSPQAKAGSTVNTKP
jgi:hypothetical protein